MSKFNAVVSLIIVVLTSCPTPAQAAELATESNRAGSFMPWFNRHTVQLEVDDVLKGTVRRFGPDGALVGAKRVRVFFYRRGELIKIVRADDEGNFLALVPPGVYSVMAGDLGDRTGFTGTMVNVVPHVPKPIPVNPRRTAPYGQKTPTPQSPAVDLSKPPAAPASLNLALIDPADVAILRAKIASHILRSRARTIPVAAAPVVLEKPSLPLLLATTREAQALTAVTHSERIVVRGYDSRWRSIPFDGPWHFNHEMFVAPGQGIQGKLRTLDASGGIVPITDATLYFVSNHKEQAAAVTSVDGRFQTPVLAPGVYSVIAVNDRSFGACAVRFVNGIPAAPETLPQSTGPIRQASFQPGSTDGEENSFNSTIPDEDSSNAFLGNDGENGLGSLETPLADTGTPPGGGAGGGGLSPEAAAALGAGLAALLGYGLYEALASHNN
ncbi:MAG: hypothetical protein JNL96_20675 [Planctomycetaceae bacterium]|nr:hypothetical protein [Planctomycetaceae bacterium]